jgi:hypothetical protein
MVRRNWLAATCGAAVLLAAASAADANIHVRPPAFYPVGDVGSNPRMLDAGDFDGDGVLDIVTADPAMGSGSTVSVLIGRPDGSFEDAGLYDSDPRPLSVAVGDFDEDDLDDFALPLDFSDAASIWFSNGDETFDALDVPLDGVNPSSVAVGDFDGDGHLDVAVGGTGIALLLGDGAGDFAEPASYTGGGTIAAADVNGDGRDDLVGPGTGPDPAIAVRLGQADGTLADPVATPVSSCCIMAIAVADVDGDGFDDVVVSYMSSSVLSVMRGGSSGALGAPLDLPFPDQSARAGIGDADGDGALDLVAAGFQGLVRVWLGAGDGTFPGHVDRETDGSFFNALAEDFDGDGFADLAAIESQTQSVVVSLNAPFPVVSPGSLAFGDVNVGATSQRLSVSMANDGEPPLHVGAVSVAGANPGDFRVTANGCSNRVLGTGESCAVTLEHAPTAAGSRTAELVLAGDGAEGPARVALSGTGVSQTITPPPPPDLTAPEMSAEVASRKLAAAIKRGLGLTLGCSESCTLKAKLVLTRREARRIGLDAAGRIVAGRNSETLAQAGTAELRVKLKKRVRKALRDEERVKLKLKVSAVDGAGNVATLTRTVRLRR